MSLRLVTRQGNPMLDATLLTGGSRRPSQSSSPPRPNQMKATLMLDYPEPVVTDQHRQAASMFLCWPMNVADLCKRDEDLPRAIEAVADFIARWEAKGRGAAELRPDQQDFFYD